MSRAGRPLVERAGDHRVEDEIPGRLEKAGEAFLDIHSRGQAKLDQHHPVGVFGEGEMQLHPHLALKREPLARNQFEGRDAAGKAARSCAWRFLSAGSN